MNYLIIDTGTTNCRVRLFYNKQYVDSCTQQIGAKDVAITGSNKRLKNSLKENIEILLEKHQLTTNDIDAVLAVGMISSNIGLFEVPPTPGSAGISDLNIVTKDFSDIFRKPIHFIPGVLTNFKKSETPLYKDVMRGEESEIFGYLSTLPERIMDESLFIHYGSHHKCIKVRNNKIVDCSTSITGELMMTILNQTTVKDSLPDLEQFNRYDMAWVKKGFEHARERGFGRSLFTIRLLRTIEQTLAVERSSFYLGTLLSLDFQAFSQMISVNTSQVIMYGKTLFPALFSQFLREHYPDIKTIIIPEHEANMLSAIGAIKIFETFLHNREVKMFNA